MTVLAPLAGLIAAAALTACMESAAPTGNELAIAAAGGTKPVITQQPAEQIFPRVGDRYAFGVTASSATPMTYRWQSCLYQTNCTDIPFANGSTYTRIAHGSDSSYYFRCIVSNASGSTASHFANAWPLWVGAQAEDGNFTGAAVSNSGTDWSGTGYVFFWSNTGTITVKPKVNNAGTYKLWIRYKSGSASSMKIEVNGAVVKSSLALPSGTYNNFILIDIPLTIGISTIKATLLSGSPIVDAFFIF